MFSRLLRVGVFAMALLQVNPAYGQDRSGRFWLHANLGFGYQTLSADDVSFLGGSDDWTLKPDPTAFNFTLGLGAFLSDKLVLLGEMGANGMPGPKIEIGDMELTTDEDFTASAIYFGGGIQYYFLPTWYVSGTAGIYRMQWEVENFEATTDPGFGFCVAAGKEWPISDKIALGAALHGLFGFGAAFSFAWVPKGIR